MGFCVLCCRRALSRRASRVAAASSALLDLVPRMGAGRTGEPTRRRSRRGLVGSSRLDNGNGAAVGTV